MTLVLTSVIIHGFQSYLLIFPAVEELWEKRSGTRTVLDLSVCLPPAHQGQASGTLSVCV